MKILVVLLLFVASAAYGEIYTWKDARGTLFYTNSLYEIPARYRSRAKQLDVASGKKSPIAAGQPGGQAGAPGASTGTPGQPVAAQQPTGQQVPAQQTHEERAPAPNPAVASPAPPAAQAAGSAAPRPTTGRERRRLRQQQNTRSGEE